MKYSCHILHSIYGTFFYFGKIPRNSIAHKNILQLFSATVLNLSCALLTAHRMHLDSRHVICANKQYNTFNTKRTNTSSLIELYLNVVNRKYMW
jgi:hypothetical protein